MAKKIKFMDCSFRDGFQSCLGARVKTEDFLPALEAAKNAGTTYFEIGGGARFQSLYFYCQEDAFDMMDQCRKVVGPDVNLQTLARGNNVVGLISQSRDIIDLHAKMFKKHGITTIRNFDALNDVRNISYSGRCIANAGLRHQVTVTLMGLPPGLDKGYAHSPAFYIKTLQDILKDGVPFTSVAFKDASGTTPPSVVYETIKQARAILPSDIEIQFHTHDTAGMAVACNYAAIQGGADVIDLAMAPLSGGTCEADILVMWQKLRGDADYTLDIDPDKIMKAEDVFTKCMDKYFIPPESMQVSPKIIFSPMPGGALTANTQMMRDNNCLDKYDACIEAMREVVEKGGFGTSVTPVSQFYFQQAFANVMQGKWKKMTDGYGKMVLGYFGHTPAEPDPEIVKIASEQLGLQPTTEDVLDINDRNPALGIPVMKKKLEEAGLPTTDENIFIVATCGDKGLSYLKGDKPSGIRYKEEKKAATAGGKLPAAYTATVDGKAFNVQVTAENTVVVDGMTFKVDVSTGTAKPAAAAAGSGKNVEIKAPMPGTVLRVLVEAGDTIAEGDEIMILEAMKMETPVKAEKAGKVVEVCVSDKEVVTADQVLAIIEEN